MLEGVIILNESLGIAYDYIGVIIGSLFAVLAFMTFLFIIEFETWVGVVIGVFLTLFMIFISVTSFISSTERFVQYEVTIDKFVNFKEFNERYEIVDQRGEIYVIREKEINK